MTTQELARAALIGAYPEGAAELYDLGDRAGDVSLYFDALAQAIKAHASDQVDKIRQETLPSSAVDLLPDWESVYLLGAGKVAAFGSVAMRQGQVVARLREHGASSLPNIAAALSAVCGYTPAILEHGRAAVTAEHTVISSGPSTIIASGVVSRTFQRADNAPASKGGAWAGFVVTHPEVEQLEITLMAPSGTFKTWAAGSWAGVKGSVTSQAFALGSPVFANDDINGTWSLFIQSGSTSTGTLGDCSVFVEGIGRLAGTSVEGLGAIIFEWGVAIREASCSSTYDRDTARAIVKRWNPAHCRVDLALYQPEDDTLGMVVGGTNCIVGIAVVG